MVLSQLHQSKQDGSLVEGYYRLTDYRERVLHGQRTGILQLEDASRIEGRILTTTALDSVRALPVSSVVRAWLKARPHGAEMYVDLLGIRRATIDEIPNGASLLSIGNDAPDAVRQAQQTLVAFNESIANPALKTFLTRVLLDPIVAKSFTTASASLGYHHAGRGGLLIHSTDMLEQARTMAEALFVDNADAIAITQLGYLLHDLGKVRTHAFVDACVVQPHEQVMLKILDPHLTRLEVGAPSAARALRLILGYCAQSRRGRGFAPSIGASIVIWCDQLSTTRDRGMRGDPLLLQRESAMQMEIRSRPINARG